jgi:hypothetical protein
MECSQRRAESSWLKAASYQHTLIWTGVEATFKCLHAESGFDFSRIPDLSSDRQASQPYSA